MTIIEIVLNDLKKSNKTVNGIIELNISKFKGSFKSLNAKHYKLQASIWDIARAISTIGYKDLSESIAESGHYRVLEMIFKCYAYLEINENNQLVINKTAYEKLDVSEKRVISYYFGQALTKLFCERKLKTPIVDHISKYIERKSITIKRHHQAPSKFVLDGINDLNKKAREPDLIAFTDNLDFHVLEAKGSTTGFKKTTLQHAIKQVSQVISIKNNPLTRIACFFDLNSKPVTGYIVDPKEGKKGIDIDINRELALKDYYTPFAAILKQELGYQYKFLGNNYIGILVVIFNNALKSNQAFFYGVDKEIATKLVNLKSSEQFSSFMRKKFQSYQESSYLGNRHEVSQGFSLGPDGILFVDLSNSYTIQPKK